MHLELLIFVAFLVVAATGSNNKKKSSKTFTLYSSEFSDGDYLPDAYTCSGKGLSPPLYWKYAPSGTKQFFLYLKTDVYRDRYDFLYTRVDWTVYNIDADVEKIQTDNSGKVGTIGGTYPGESMHEYNAPCPTDSAACECHTYEYGRWPFLLPIHLFKCTRHTFGYHLYECNNSRMWRETPVT